MAENDWKTIKFNNSVKCFKVNNFTYMSKGTTYTLEIDEYSDGSYVGHGEQSNDESSVVASVNGESIKECIELLVKNIEK